MKDFEAEYQRLDKELEASRKRMDESYRRIDKIVIGIVIGFALFIILQFAILILKIFVL